MKRKRLLLLVPTIALSFGLFGCKNADTPGPDKPDPNPPIVEVTKVTKVILSIDDESGEGSLEKPFNLKGAQGETLQIPFTVLPNNASNKTLRWEVGRIVNGAFKLDNETGVTVEAAQSPAKIMLGAKTEGNVALKVSTTDESNIVNYVNIVVESYIPVSDIAVNGLLKSESTEYDYIFKTAKGTNWDMSGSQLKRGEELLKGNVVGGLQAPRNLTYWPTLYNFNIQVNPLEASDPAFTVESNNENVFKLKTDGTYEIVNDGEALVTIKSHAQKDVETKVKVEVAKTLYDGILQSEYDKKEVSTLSSWDLDSDHATDAQFKRYDDWNLVMMQANSRRGDEGIDSNQKIFYMGEPTRPYGIDIENRVDSNSGVDATKASGMMWAKLQVPQKAKTFNIKLGSTGSKAQGEYRVLFVLEDGTKHILTGTDNGGWKGFSGPNEESTIKLELADSIKGKNGAMVLEHRVPTKDANAELSIKKLNFEGQVDPTGITISKNSGTHKPGDSFNLLAKVTPDNVTNGAIRYYVDPDSVNKGITIDNNGQVNISETTPEGNYSVWAESVANPEYKAQYLITVKLNVTVNEWNNKNDILYGVSGYKWSIVGPGDGNTNCDLGVGEGADIHAGASGYAALELTNRKITADAPILTFRARTFRPATEILPEFMVKVIENETEKVIKAIGSTEDKVLVNNEEGDGVNFAYDLSEFIGKSVTLQIGIDRGNHGVVTKIKFIKDQIAATSVMLKKNSGEYLRNKEFSFNAFVQPWDASNSFVEFSVDKEGQGVTVTGIGSIATVKISADATLGDYKIIAKAKGSEVSSVYSLKVYSPDANVETNTWNNKEEILNGVNGVSWTIDGAYWEGTGEGVDLKVDGSNWSAIKLENREIKHSSFIFKFGARVFHRDGETYPKFELRITSDGVTETIKGIGQTESYFFVDTDDTQYCSYDLSAYIGKTVKVELGITTGTHAVIQNISFTGNPTNKTSWMNKDEILNGGWLIQGDTDAGVGEGADIKGTATYLHQEFVIGSHNDEFSFGARVFHRDGETYPDIKLVIVDGTNEEVIKANGVDTDTVHVDTDDVQIFTYNLSKYVGKKVSIRITLANNATHCVITQISQK
ncbi:MAG: hypothetical protein MR606_02920 [Mollicutes bacterium]|nr:hypothetical protein [Mollicutes bacterium]MDD7264375.1 hypothetical protein [bacterium]MDY4979705.1 hypothetical protein [Candidatus Onthovivens sp.]